MDVRRSFTTDARPGRWWRLFGVGLGLLLVGDLLTTLWARSVVGLGGEANPLMRSLLAHSLWSVVAVHLVVGAVAILSFGLFVDILSRLDPPEQRWLGRWCERWLIGLILAGAAIVCNNVAVVLLASPTG